MAYAFPQSEGMTKEQAEALRELNAFAVMSDSAAWKKIKESLDATVAAPQKELLDSTTGNLEELGILALCWRERELVRRGLIQFVENHITERQKLLEELKEQNGDSTNDTRSNDQ